MVKRVVRKLLPATVAARLKQWRRRTAPSVVVLMYHRVVEVPCDPWELCVSPKHFDEHLSVLRRHYQVLSADELSVALQRGHPPRKSVVITFDDGYADNLLNAKPILESHGLTAMLFLTSGALDSAFEFWWDAVERIFLHAEPLPVTLELSIAGQQRSWELGDGVGYDEAQWAEYRGWRATQSPRISRQRVYYEVWDSLRPLRATEQNPVLDRLAAWAGQTRTARSSHRLLTIPEARELISGDTFRFGGHTVSHPALSSHSRTFQEQEVRDGKLAIERQFGVPVKHFAYPYGDYSEDSLEIIADLGFETAFSTEPRAVVEKADLRRLPRYKVDNWDGAEFASQLQKMFNRQGPGN